VPKLCNFLWPPASRHNVKEQYLALRGASWFTVGEIYLRSAYRYSVHPSDRCDIDGFRCVLEVDGS